MFGRFSNTDGVASTTDDKSRVGGRSRHEGWMCSPLPTRFLDPHGRTRNDMVGGGMRYGLVLPFDRLRINLASELVSKLGWNSSTWQDTLNPAPPRFLDPHGRTRNDMAVAGASRARCKAENAGDVKNSEPLRMSGLEA